ncbi:hypothetical protein EAF00_007279 [Botryotinia globosa]|nr:hypothetical protein EAF00_007279 [Botryotinia globosa]
MQRNIFLLLFLASRAGADGTDVTNNLFSDLGPLLALFGETFAQQFLRESFTWLDHIIFAMAPLGIITAIIGAIRVGGPPQLKALIGRARENRASAELDFMSSTSHEVSELWNGHNIVRTMGKGEVKQILFLEGRGPPEKLGLFTLSDAEKEKVITRKAYSNPFIDIVRELWRGKALKLWKRTSVLIDKLRELRRKETQKPWKRTSVSKTPNNDSHNNMSGGTNSEEGHFENDGLDQAPNISLNIHPKQNRGELFVAAVLGIILQAGVIIFSAFVAYDNRFGAAVGGRPSAYAFPTLASGTAVLVIGMGICALVIGESTDECVWEIKADGNVTTQQVEGSHQPKFRAPSEDVETGGVNESYEHHEHLWTRILGKLTRIPLRAGERMPKLSFEAIKPNAKKSDSESRKSLIFWLQKRFVVSDQTFDSYMLMAGIEKELIMTSCRSDNYSLGAESSHPIIEDTPNKIGAFQMRSFQVQPSDTVSNRSSRSSHSRSMHKSPIPSKQIPPYESTSKWINTLCIIGTSTGIIGFVLQFEGFRGISWACSIAQLVAIMIMTVVRAIIRRGMLDKPIAQKIPEKYEIDWLALKIGNDDKYLSDLSKSTVHRPSPSPYHPSWKVCSQINLPVQVTSKLMPITNESIIQEIVKIRKKIRELTVGPETRPSELPTFRLTNICVGSREIPVQVEPNTSDSTIPKSHGNIQGSRATPKTLIEECLQMLTASWDPAKNKPMMQKFVRIRKRLQELTDCWETNEKSFRAQKVLKVRTRLRELTGWSDPVIKASAASAASAIEIIMSIFKGWPDSTFHWLIDVKIGTGEDTVTQKIKLHATIKKEKEERSAWRVSAKDIESVLSLWMYHFSYNRQSDDHARNNTENISRDLHSFRRVIGHSRSSLKRDMTWWAGIESAEALGEFSWDDQNDSECLSMGFCLPAELDHNKTTKGAHFPKSFYYAMIANVSKEKFLAQHIFSTFLWAVVDSLPLTEIENKHQTEVVLPRDDKLRLNEKHPNWNSLRLTNKTIKQMTNAVESSGLGTLEDANSLIIPPLSYSDKLPNEDIVDTVRKKANDNELGHRDIACNLYAKLLKLCDDLPPEGNFVYKVVSTAVDFLVTATSASETKKYMERSDGNLEKSKRILVAILRSKHKTCLDMLQSLYAKQGRLKNFGKAGLLDHITKNKVKGSARNGQTILHRKIIDNEKFILGGHMEKFLNTADILGWTPLHYAVIYSLEAVQKLVKKKRELVNNFDLAGRTPLHYAVMKQKDDLKQDNAEEIIKKLLEAGAEPLQGKDGLVPLHWAVKTRNVKATKLLLELEIHEKTLNFKDYSGMTPLHFAALGGNSEILEILLKKVISAQDLNAQNRLGRTALHVAVRGINTDRSTDRAEIIEMLINKEASVAIKDKDGKKALNVAVEMEQKMKSPSLPGPDLSEEPSHLVDILGGILEIEHWDNPDNSNGKVVVDEKAKKPKEAGKAKIPSKEEQLASVIKTLLRKENLTVDGGKLLLWAVENNFKTPFEFVIDSKEIAIDTSQLNTNNGRSILHLAVHAKSEKMIDKILWRWRPSNNSSPSKPSPHVNLPDRQGITALMLAASEGYDLGVKKLLVVGVDKFLRDVNGRTALSWGAESGNLNILTQLINSGVTLRNEPMTKNSPMFVAVENGRHEAIKLFLANGADSNDVETDGDSLLCYAVTCGHTECVKVLIEHGAELEKRSGMYEQTALSFAAKNGNLEIVKLLLDFGARMEAQDTDDWTPFIWALKCEHPKVVNFLLGEEVKRVSSKTQYMEQLDFAMTLACKTGNFELMEQLLDLVVDPNAQDAVSRSTALQEATRRGFLRIVKLLLMNRVDINAMDDAGETPLLLAIRHEFYEITECLLRAEANINITNGMKETPLLLAVRYNNESITCLLLSWMPDPNIASNTGETPLLWATRNGNENITKLLLETRADVNAANYSNETPLALASIYRNMDIIRLLLSKGANIEQEWGNYQRMFLLQAVYAEDEELVLLSLEAGAKPEREKKHARNALQEAIRWGAENIVDHLLSFGASAESRDMQGRTGFQFAAQIGALSLLKKLIKESSEGLHLIRPNFHDLQDRDLLHHAFVSRSIDMISYLIDRFSPSGNDYHRKDINGWTPLHWAAQAGNLEVVQMLLEVDARSDAKVKESIKNWTPRQIASYNGHSKIVKFLKPSSIPNEALPYAGFLHVSFRCDGCNCKIRGFRFHCENCANFDFCEKCKVTSDTTHPNHEFDKIGSQRETEPEQEVSPQQEGGLMQDDSSSESRSVHEDSVEDDVAF